ncbi:hypothetical protein [Streptococcus oricebi]|uniref:DUF2974 domain-containing protein n=1 Tax=Streptococcus oricebi TaxID=1547447 RepID=A0ABS5B567_9STRE|nr:hypothetical protein [Streptococcus oricebi]MBP2623986.1 hypothetical protein [Streptococcus oricebi]
MTYVYTDKQLNELNQKENVYSVNPNFATRKENRTSIVVAKPDSKLKKGETNTLTIDGQDFRVVATKTDKATGFDGLAVAPIVNGKPDYKSVAVIAAGTDPDSKENAALSTPWGTVSRDFWTAMTSGMTNGSVQYAPADAFVQELMENKKYRVVQLSGYSQGAFMLKVGAKYHIPTTTFNSWFAYNSLNAEERAFVKKHPELFIDYRKTNDDVVLYNDLNRPELTMGVTGIPSLGYGTIYWVEGKSHKVEDWKFDKKTGQVLDKKGGQVLATGVFKPYAYTLKEMEAYKDLKKKWASKGISQSEQIFLDAAQGGILSSNMVSTARLGATEMASLADKYNQEVEAIWSKIDFSSYQEFSAEEVEALFAAQGVTYDKIVSDFQTYSKTATTKMEDLASSFETLDGQVQAGIEELMSTDKKLAGEFKEWKKDL